MHPDRPPSAKASMAPQRGGRPQISHARRVKQRRAKRLAGQFKCFDGLTTNVGVVAGKTYRIMSEHVCIPKGKLHQYASCSHIQLALCLPLAHRFSLWPPKFRPANAGGKMVDVDSLAYKLCALGAPRESRIKLSVGYGDDDG